MALVQTPAPSAEASRTPYLGLGDFICTGLFTRSGLGLRIMKVGDAVLLSSLLTTSETGKTSFGKAFRSVPPTTYLACRNQQVGKLSGDLGRAVGLLLAAGLITAGAVCIEAPPQINMLAECLLEVSVSYTKPL